MYFPPRQIGYIIQFCCFHSIRKETLFALIIAVVKFFFGGAPSRCEISKQPASYRKRVTTELSHEIHFLTDIQNYVSELYR